MNIFFNLQERSKRKMNNGLSKCPCMQTVQSVKQSKGADWSGTVYLIWALIKIGELTNKIKFEEGAYERGSANWNVGD